MSCPGRDLARLIRSLTELAATDGCSATTSGVVVASVMGEKSRTASQVASLRISGSIQTVLPDNSTNLHRDLICSLAARYRLPAIYPFRRFVSSGGLAYYGADTNDMYRKLAGYVDRILRGVRPPDLPVQTPTKFELVVNLKVAKTLNLTIPPTFLAHADEVIE